MFVLGCPSLMVSVDHKPLVAIFGDRDLEKITKSRLQNLKERSLMYKFRIKQHFGPDATTHYPAPNSTISQRKNSDISTGIKSSIVASYKSDQHLQASHGRGSSPLLPLIKSVRNSLKLSVRAFLHPNKSYQKVSGSSGQCERNSAPSKVSVPKITGSSYLTHSIQKYLNVSMQHTKGSMEC